MQIAVGNVEYSCCVAIAYAGSICETKHISELTSAPLAGRIAVVESCPFRKEPRT
jgi:hypothetical protein